MPVLKLKGFLDENGVKYVTIQHSAAYTAQEIAAHTHIPGKELAKTVMVKVDGKLAMAVVPASHRVDFDRLRDVAGAQDVELAGEAEFKDFFPACDVGAMPPFGNLYDMEVYVSDTLSEDVEIAFSAGSHSELIRLAYADYERLAQPKIAGFSKRAL
jgi:Ala-tRNA(Pro) deacylase